MGCYKNLILDTNVCDALKQHTAVDLTNRGRISVGAISSDHFVFELVMRSFLRFCHGTGKSFFSFAVLQIAAKPPKNASIVLISAEVRPTCSKTPLNLPASTNHAVPNPPQT